MTQYLREVLALLGPDRRRLAWIIVAFVLSSALEVVGLGLVAPFVQIVVGGEGAAGPDWFARFLPTGGDRFATLAAFGIVVVLVFAAKATTAIALNFVVIRFCQQQEVRMRGELLSAFFAMPHDQVQRRNLADHVQAITQLTGLFAGGVLLPGLKTVGELLLCVAILGALAWYDPAALCVLLAGAGVLIFAYDRWFRRRLRETGELRNVSMQSLIRGVNEAFDGSRELRLLGRQGMLYRSIMRDAAVYAGAMTRMQAVAAAPRYLLETVMVTFVLGISILFALRGQQGDSALAAVGVFGFAAARLLPAANYLASNLVQVRFYRDTVRRLSADHEWVRNPEPAVAVPPLAAAARFEELDLRDVSYAYAGAATPALSAINLRIRRGECVGIVGSSGSGKSTLAGILSGLMRPSSGDVLLNGRVVRPGESAWDGLVAYLPQTPFLLDGSFAENIAFSRDSTEIDRDGVWRAVVAARLEGVVARVGAGIDGRVGERGGALSGGERQRVILARAIYFDRPLLIFDESTSALDIDLEREVVEQVAMLRGSRTVVVIAHRLAALQHCDRVIRLDAGRVVRVGSREEVIGGSVGI